MGRSSLDSNVIRGRPNAQELQRTLDERQQVRRHEAEHRGCESIVSSRVSDEVQTDSLSTEFAGDPEIRDLPQFV
jgi:hypothetical protein